MASGIAVQQGGARVLAKAGPQVLTQPPKANEAPSASSGGDRLALSRPTKALAKAPEAAQPIAPKRAALWGAVAGFVGAPAALGLLGLMAQPFSLGLSPAVFGVVSGLCGPAFAGLAWCLAKMQGQEAKKRAGQA